MNIKVNIWNHFVGSLVWDDANLCAVFKYDSDFVKSGLELSPFLMPLDENKIYSFPRLNRDTFKGLPPIFADSLPDDFGNSIMRAWLLKQNKTTKNLLPTERLGYIGQRGMGALEYEPVLDKENIFVGTVDFMELVDVANRVLNAKLGDEFGDLNQNSLNKIIHIGTSAGGARAKAILALDEINNIYKPGDILHGENHSYWLLKLDGISNKNL